MPNDDSRGRSPQSRDRETRRLANRRATPRKPPKDDSRLVQAARDGILTKDNTKSGTRGRQAVDRVTFLRRKAARPHLSARESLGHRVTGTRPRVASFYADNPPRFVIVEGISARDIQRAGSYMGSVGALLNARASGGSDWEQVSRAFERRFRRWASIAGLNLLADPAAVVALAEAQRAGELGKSSSTPVALVRGVVGGLHDSGAMHLLRCSCRSRPPSDGAARSRYAASRPGLRCAGLPKLPSRRASAWRDIGIDVVADPMSARLLRLMWFVGRLIDLNRAEEITADVLRGFHRCLIATADCVGGRT